MYMKALQLPTIDIVIAHKNISFYRRRSYISVALIFYKVGYSFNIRGCYSDILYNSLHDSWCMYFKS